MGTKNLVNLKKYAFTNLNILPKKGGGCGTRMILKFGGGWHKNDLDVKYIPLIISLLVIFGNSDHLTLPQHQQQQPKPGEYFITPIFSQKMPIFSIFLIFMIGFSNC